MKFNLFNKTYQDEDYSTEELEWNGAKVKACVVMQYHTFLKYWGVAYYWAYGENFNQVIPNIKYQGDIEGKNGRKEARKIAEKYMQEAKLEDLDNIDDFYKNEIMGALK